MPDLLIYCPDSDLNLELQQIAKAQDFRVKTAFDFKTAREWLKVREFDVMFVHGTVSIKDQQDLAGLLWKRNLQSLFYVFDLATEGIERPEIRLLGAELVKGKNAVNSLTKVLRNYQLTRPIENPDFRIMVVEDLDSPRDIICMFIEGLGFSQVDGFPSASAALNELQQEPDKYSCIVTDVRMPKVTGCELIEIVRADTRIAGLPIIVLTAFGTVDCLIDCLKAGASGFLVKPPKKKDIGRELARAKRICAHNLNPRLVREGDVDSLREVLFAKGFV